MKVVSGIEINLDTIKEGLRLRIDSRRESSMFDGKADALENNEARYQLVEGCYYDFQMSDPEFMLGDIGNNIVQRHSLAKGTGTISPNIFVGTLSIPLIETSAAKVCGNIELEVQSVKSGYRDEYRDMLELITEKCTDLLMQSVSPVSHSFEVDYTKDPRTLYQKFAFIKSIIHTNEFAEALHRIITAPVTQWTETTENKDVRNVRRFSGSSIREVLKGGRRTKLSDAHYLKSRGIETLPDRISSIRKTDSVDTAENRFIKHALETFLSFCNDISKKAKEFGHKKTENESELLIRELEGQLQHSIFKEISAVTTLKLNSPVLQRKEGYREILRVWLMFDLAAKLIWSGGEDVYSGGKRDIATLYEYWLFFKLLDLFQDLFELEPRDISDLIRETPDGMNLQIKQGKFTALRGVYNSGSRKLNIRFNYNRSFGGGKKYPDSGSWTTTLRPDYTLSFWPDGISEQLAEKQELIVHVHFDAKYKVANLSDFFRKKNERGLNEEKTENRKGIYKNADLLKMHAYKDAIRRTGGAYVLYPGDRSSKKTEFHEIIPGLGAFPVKPSKTDSGTGALKAFITEITEHFINRASQRERLAFRTFDIYKNSPLPGNELKKLLPEPYHTNRDLIPDDTNVLIGYYNSPEHYQWIKNKGLYNFAVRSDFGLLILDQQTVSAKYLLLFTLNDAVSGDLWEIVSRGPGFYSGDELEQINYPSVLQDSYIIELKPVNNPEFKNINWDFRSLQKFSEEKSRVMPFTVSLTELMNTTV